MVHSDAHVEQAHMDTDYAFIVTAEGIGLPDQGKILLIP